MHRERNRGFTLLELITTLAVAAVILSVGVPGFMSFMANNRATTDTNDVITALNLARSEATRRGAEVIVCSSTDASTCDGDKDWSTGWVVRSGGDVLRVWPQRSDTNVITANVEEVRFAPRGSLSGIVPDIQVRLPDCTGNNGRDIEVNLAGRISVARVGC